MNNSFSVLDRYQYVLDDYRREGDDLDLPREITWTYTFLEKKQVERFECLVRHRFPSMLVSITDLECESKLTLVPTALELATVEAELDEISMKIANRTESSISIPTAVPIAKYRD
jgi:hypothetical protein